MADIEEKLVVWGPYSGLHPRGFGAGKLFVNWQSGIYPQRKINSSSLSQKTSKFAKFTCFVENKL
ncbi:MAG: hypothetical protein ACK4J0_02510 [Candidatus Anstonellaceae archaeon]